MAASKKKPAQISLHAALGLEDQHGLPGPCQETRDGVQRSPRISQTSHSISPRSPQNNPHPKEVRGWTMQQSHRLLFGPCNSATHGSPNSNSNFRY